MDDKLALAVALFRFSVISPVLHLESMRQMEYFREMAQKEFDVPHYGRCRYDAATFKSWLRDYRRGGIDNLKPRPRSDKGVTRVIDSQLGELIKEKRHRYPVITGSAFYKLMVSEGILHSGAVSEPTLRRFLKSQGLFKIAEEVKARKKFEREHNNELWIGDFMHGLCFLIDRRKTKVFLCAIIDDYSRMVVGGEFFLRENTLALEKTFKGALLKYGVPQRFYCDNGAVYQSQHLQLVCSRLAISLIHSKPYDSPSRGKIERLFRSIRDRFLALIPRDEATTLADLNTRFQGWLDKEYHHHYHHGIDTRPIDRWMADLEETAIRRLSEHELDESFLQTLHRKVKNDSTVSVERTLYEVPPKYIGEVIELRFPTDKPEEISVYENGLPVVRIKKVDPHENAANPVAAIRFSRQEDQGGEP